jgi:hypothetical protein
MSCSRGQCIADYYEGRDQTRITHPQPNLGMRLNKPITHVPAQEIVTGSN